MSSFEWVGESRTLCTNAIDLLNSAEFFSWLETVLVIRKKYQVSHILWIFKTLLQKDRSSKLSELDKSDLVTFLNDLKVEELRYEYMWKYKKLRNPTIWTHEEIANWVSFINSLEIWWFNVIKNQLLEMLWTKRSQESIKPTNKKVRVKVWKKVEIVKTWPKITTLDWDEFLKVKELHVGHVCSINSEAIMKLKTWILPIDFHDYKIEITNEKKDEMKIIDQSDIVVDYINSLKIESIKIYVVRFSIGWVKYVSVSIPEEMNLFDLSETIRWINKKNNVWKRFFNDNYLSTKVSDKFNWWLTLRIDSLNTKEKGKLLYLANEVLSSWMLLDSNFAIIVLSEIMVWYLWEKHKILLEKLLNWVTSLVEEDVKLLKEQRQVFWVSMEDILYRMVPYLNNWDENKKNKSIMFNINLK